MSWNGNPTDRRSTLPPNWASEIVPAVKRRAKKTSSLGFAQCEARLPRSGKRCPAAGTDVDHKRDRDDHSMANLQLLCEHHHDAKTSGQGHSAWSAKKKKAKRPDEVHPGRMLR